MNDLVTKLFLAIPWFFIIWLISQSIDGAIDGFLTVVLVIILVPVALVLNVATSLFARGNMVIKQMKDMQDMQNPQKQKVRADNERRDAVNYADLPWYDVRKWTQR